MPRDKDLKRLVRTRMQKTGESYTAARTQLLRKSPAKTGATPPAPHRDYARLAGMADAVMREKTGRTWEEWTRALDTHAAHDMPHGDIARLVRSTYKVPDWWTQCVTVGYERIKGLRARGQRRDGTFEANKSRTFNVPVSTLFEAWTNVATRRRWLDGATVKVRTATPHKSIRLGWTDGAITSIVAVGFLAKGDGKSAVAVQHMKLPDKATADRLKKYWTEQFGRLGDMLAEKQP